MIRKPKIFDLGNLLKIGMPEIYHLSLITPNLSLYYTIPATKPPTIAPQIGPKTGIQA
jgi:hypothetical protein